MPFQVKGADGRVIETNLPDQDAEDLARRIAANTGETVTLIPWNPTPEGYVLDTGAAREITHIIPTEDEPADEEAAAEEEIEETVIYDLETLNAEELDALAVKWEVADWDPDADLETKRAILNETHATAVGPAVDFTAMTGDELDAYAAEHKVDGYTRKVRRSPVEDRQAFLASWFAEHGSDS